MHRKMSPFLLENLCRIPAAVFLCHIELSQYAMSPFLGRVCRSVLARDLGSAGKGKRCPFRTLAITGRVLFMTCHTQIHLKKEDKNRAFDDCWFNIEWTGEDIRIQQEYALTQVLEQEWIEHCKQMKAEAF